MFDFVNRESEIRELDACAAKSGLVVIFGRRRVGKTRLLTKWLRRHGGIYTQAIESDPGTQLAQVFEEIRHALKTDIVPKNWSEFLDILDLQNKKLILCIDEFPYLVSSDGSVPSRFQKWLDHGKSRKILLILCGSSRHMMHDTFLNYSAPLYGRATRILKLEPMKYKDFCQARKLKQSSIETFIKYSMVGGIPKYWEFIEKNMTAIEIASRLYFDLAPYMENEPKKILADERITSQTLLNLLEIIGRGAERPSEMAARLGTVQTNLSRSLEQLVDASVLKREIPFGESDRATKKSLYKINDPSLRFWFRTYSPNRVLWHSYDEGKKFELLRQHASTVFEEYCRTHYPSASRYWDKNIEIDMIRPEARNIVVSEIKFKKLSETEKRRILSDLAKKWLKSPLSAKFPNPRFEVTDTAILEKDPGA